jgi:4-hydroxybenzoate polyprenyltransferase
VPPLLQLLRPAHWLKNLLVLAPLLLSSGMAAEGGFARALLGMMVFCLLAGASYILNDYMDRLPDLLHPLRRDRPLAAGTVPVSTAFILMGLLTAGGLLIAAQLSGIFFLICLGYLALMGAYSSALKPVAILDVMAVAGGYLLRVQGGAVLTGQTVSPWLLVCIGLASLCLALAKRRDDIARDFSAGHRRSQSGYNRQFVDVAIGLVLTGLLVVYIIFTLLPETTAFYGSGSLTLTIPFVLLAELRFLQIIFVEEKAGPPSRVLTRDPFIIFCLTGWLFCFALLVRG